jgi:16S rRNA (cytidine1402-2'-O)-methyltransferase
MAQLGNIYLIPNTLGGESVSDILPADVQKIATSLRYFAVEEIKSARRLLRKMDRTFPIDDSQFFIINKHTKESELMKILMILIKGNNIGIISEAGCPGVADPGAVIVKLAHEKGIQVIPLVGPSSILLAIMASGMNGQSFAFNGYIPIDKSEKRIALKALEKLSIDKNQSQIFIETPFRNNKMLEDILQSLHPETHLCIATDITLPTEYIKTMRVAAWKKTVVDLHNRPTIFIIHKM